MPGSDVLARVMDATAHRVLFGTERAYVVAIDTMGDLAHLDRGAESQSSWAAYILWAQISDLLDDPRGPQSEELCNEIATAFSRQWLALEDRETESKQDAFMTRFVAEFEERLAKYSSTHTRPHPPTAFGTLDSRP